LSGHTDWVKDLAFSPDGCFLATASSDGTARLWKVPSGALVTILSGHIVWVNDVAFSPQGRYLATGSYDFTAKLWGPVP
jgi:WD40 repeat protein